MASNLETVDIGSGVSLPVFEQETVHCFKIMQKWDILGVLAAGDKFNRYLRIMPGLRLPLSDILTTADDFFEQIAARFNATVVPHDWGLAQSFNHRASEHFRHPSLPDGLLLAARVDTLPDRTTPTFDEAFDIHFQAKQAVDTVTGTYTWYDGGVSQFSRSGQRLYLHDIEPLLNEVNE